MKPLQSQSPIDPQCPAVQDGAVALSGGAAQQRIAELEQALLLSHKALEEFTFSVSHDLRAPLRHVGAYLKIAREDLGPDIDPAIDAHLRTAGDAAQLMGRQMDGLLELSRLGRTDLRRVAVDLSQLVNQVCEQLALPTPAVLPQWQVVHPLPVVHADRALLGQMLIHLLGNAVKFCAPSTAAKITVDSALGEDGFCTLRIADNGIGFDSRFQDRLFRVFQRLHSNRQHPGLGDGLGIGLVFSRLVVERHGGTIRIRGDLQPGCEVSLLLPLAPSVA